MGGTKGKGHVGQMNPSLFIFTTNSHLPLWPVNSGKPGSKSVEFILPLPVKSRHLLSHKSQSVTRQRFFFYSECYYYVTRANVRIDGVYLRFVFACLSLFSYSSKVSVTFEKCEVNVSSSFLSFYHPLYHWFKQREIESFDKLLFRIKIKINRIEIIRS